MRQLGSWAVNCFHMNKLIPRMILLNGGLTQTETGSFIIYKTVLIYALMSSLGLTLPWLSRRGMDLQDNIMATIIKPLLKVSEMLAFLRKFTLYNIFIFLKMFMVCVHICFVSPKVKEFMK